MIAAAKKLSGTRTGGVGMTALWFLATVQCVCFYLSRVACYMQLAAYEQGHERTPFQSRMLLMAPLRWAHGSAPLTRIAAAMTAMPAWFPRGVRPEGIVEALIDLVCMGIAGLAATKLYQLSSRTRLLTAFLYPLTLLMISSTYSVLTLHAVRFVYDLPSLAFFSVGLYLIYVQCRVGWFIALFLVATTNRETTLLLLAFFLLAACSRGSRFDWRQSYRRRTLAVVLPLGAAWIGWHLWVVHRFAANPIVTSPIPRVLLNLGTLAVPLAWPQLLQAFGYILPLVIVGRRYITDRVMHGWLWALPVWFVFMLYYGIVIEIRLFGELIPYVACVFALIAEEKLLTLMVSVRTDVTQWKHHGKPVPVT